MLLNISEDFNDKKDIITDQIGKPFNLEDRKKLNGTVLRNLAVTAASIDVYNLMILNEGQSFCSLEMRTKGINISFKAKTDTYALVIPFYKLKIYKGKAEEYSFYKDHYFIKIMAGAKEPEVHQFVRKLRNFKADNASPRIEDL